MARKRKPHRRTSQEKRDLIHRNHGCSPKVWYRAKGLRVKFFGDHLWLVWGGEQQHRTYVGPDIAVCDCLGQEHAYNGVCSHIQAVKNKMYELVGRKA